MGTLPGDSRYHWSRTCLRHGDSLLKCCRSSKKKKAGKKSDLWIVKHLLILTEMMKMGIFKKIFEIVVEPRLFFIYIF